MGEGDELSLIFPVSYGFWSGDSNPCISLGRRQAGRVRGLTVHHPVTFEKAGGKTPHLQLGTHQGWFVPRKTNRPVCHERERIGSSMNKRNVLCPPNIPSPLLDTLL